MGIMALAGVGLIHVLDLPGTIQDTPYIGWLYIALIVGSIVVAFELLRTGARHAWIA